MIQKWALITGASSGIGRALALRFAKEGWQLVLVATDLTKLSALSEAIEETHHVRPVVIQKDLLDYDAPRQIFDQLSAQGIRIDVLVNNAGIGACGLFQNISDDKHAQIISLNICALTSLSKIAVSQMRQHGGGKILNVASTGAYQPGPYIAVYYATKAYVLSLTQALRKELKQSGIVVSALCPGSTSTAFSARAGKADIKGAMSAQRVADAAYKGLVNGRAVIIPGTANKVLVLFSKLLPGSLSAAIVHRIQKKLTESF